MGKSYGKELEDLRQTFSWSLEQPLGPIIAFIQAARKGPLITVGSGGSLTAARMATLLHQQAGSIAKSMTPYEVASYKGNLRDGSALILTAGGGNADVLTAFQTMAVAEPRQLLALCMKTQSKLAALTGQYHFARVAEFDPPCGKDGFLATNSLLATVVLLIRGYQEALSLNNALPDAIPDLGTLLARLAGRADAVTGKDTCVVLYGGWGLPAAVDLESKFTEAALLNVQVTDYRNFGHGRHHWLAKRGASTGIIALVTPSDADIANRTLRLLPSEIPILYLTTPAEGAGGALDLLLQALHVVHLAGIAKSIDPGRPRVPEFGRKIYHLRTSTSRPPSKDVLALRKTLAVARKAHVSGARPPLQAERELWEGAYDRFTLKLAQGVFTAVAFDFDGTLCSPAERYTGPSKSIVDQLVRLLDAGLLLGVATGRGKSVRLALQRVIPKRYWDQFLIGYYNGAEVAHLGADDRPDTASTIHPSLQRMKDYLDGNPLFQQIARYDERPMQITVSPVDVGVWPLVREVVLAAAAKGLPTSVQVVESSHSIDIIPLGVSKVRLVAACERHCQERDREGAVLCIGDQGRWPGNDFALLDTPYSLSVDLVSPELESCWNLAPAGYRGEQATSYYLNSLYGEAHRMRFRVGDKTARRDQ